MKTAEQSTRIAVLGGGNWGAALSLLLAGKGYKLSLWAWPPEQIDTMLASGENPYLPGYPLPEYEAVTTSIPEAVEDSDLVLFVTVSNAIIDVSRELESCLHAGIPVISGTKGLNSETGLTVSQTLVSVLPAENVVAALSGPNLAVEVANGVPTATVVACRDESVARDLQSMFMCPSLRVYTNADVLGVELAGALKNVIAIAAGISDGLGFGDNTKAALLTRGLAEITRLGVKLGANHRTFMGLAGVGDLIATCASPLSRNRRVGVGLGQGRKLEEVLREIGQTAEGIPTTRAAFELSHKHETPMPITEEVYKVLFEGKTPEAALADLMARSPKDEVW